MTGYVVAAASEIGPGDKKIVEVNGREIGIFNVDGRFYAIRNRCPHQGAPLCLGHQFGILQSSRPGDYRVEDSELMIQCPWHGWEFDLRTGQSWCEPDRVKVRAYPASVTPGKLLTANDVGDEHADMGGRSPGPYKVETYQVSQEEDYIVVDLERRSWPGAANERVAPSTGVK